MKHAVTMESGTADAGAATSMPTHSLRSLMKRLLRALEIASIAKVALNPRLLIQALDLLERRASGLFFLVFCTDERIRVTRRMCCSVSET